MLSATVPNFVAIDTECTGLWTWRGHRAFAASAVFPSGRILHWRDNFIGLEDILRDASIDKVFFNATFDLQMLEAEGFEIRGNVWDVRIMVHLMFSRSAAPNLDGAAKKYLPAGDRKVVEELDQWFADHKIPKKERGENYNILPPELLKKRCNGDAVLTAKLFMKLWPTCVRTYMRLMEQEHALIPVVKEMTHRGLFFDPLEAMSQAEQLDAIIEEVNLYCEGILDIEGFNINSAAHKRAVLERAGILHLITERTPKTKQYKLSDENLRGLHHPVAAMLNVGKTAAYLRNSFINQMLEHAVDNVVHPGWDQCGTVSGRFTTSKPNLMNAPGEGGHMTSEELQEQIDFTGYDLAPHIKRIFRCRPGFRHIHADKSKVEVYMAGHYSKDQVLIAILNSGRDVHGEISLRMFNSTDEHLRVRAKQVVFGWLYGAGEETNAKTIQCAVSEAREYRRLMQKMMPGLPRWDSQLKEEVRMRGYIVTDHGRRHYIYPGESYMCVNRMCQGTAADEVKSRMVALYNEFIPEFPGSTILLNYHDDVCTEVPLDYDEEKACKVYKEIMEETSLEYRVPLPVKVSTTETTWADLKEVGKKVA
ncbi:MAG: DNA polymerase [Dehalococcoidia bacterium]|nr:DNA polymerase [Dehalococcoidia bacterium]